MKLVQIVFVLLLTLIICHLVAAAPNLDYLTIDDCRGCHDDEDESTFYLHHEPEDFLDEDFNCRICHTSLESRPAGWQKNCYNCHVDFDHHEDAKGRCSDCHDDKQKKQQDHKNRHRHS